MDAEETNSARVLISKTPLEHNKNVESGLLDTYATNRN